MSFISKWIEKIRAVAFPEVTKTFEEHQVELAAVEAKATVAEVKVETTEAPKVKPAAKKAVEGEVKKPKAKAKKPNIKIAK